ncbi:hypothetical protein JRG66_00225 [Salinimicrobium tongyeongense]|uniref:Lipoprotein n=1 Tax=Salinimicrobium tongyeongense TaxID=2809707 RepID=A0ABY6NR36_9FLAO|nr:hypothetical protein [Salinimicrobium tongyeongense]UZH55369.1 hypothetical protein JRG66_00225 [Salinimicrobium tongyeongense]
MKIKSFFILFSLLTSLSGCVETTTSIVLHDSIPPEFAVDKKSLKREISAIIPSEVISFSSSKSEKSGAPIHNTLFIQITRDSLPSGWDFSEVTNEIEAVAKKGISNFDAYQKLIIEVSTHEDKDGIKHQKSYKKEINL